MNERTLDNLFSHKFLDRSYGNMVVRLARLSLLVAVALIFVFLWSSSSWRTRIKDIPQLPVSVAHGDLRSSRLAIASRTFASSASDGSSSLETGAQPTSFHSVPRLRQHVDVPASPYAYVFYAIDNLYACSALVNIHRLLSFRTRHRIHLLASPKLSDRYIEVFEALNVTVTVLDPPLLPGNPMEDYYDGCLLKLIAFRMHMIDSNLRRVIVLDADQLILRSLDSLFELPSVDLAAPRAYWIAKDAFASTMMVIEPSERLWKRVSHGIENLKPGEYDMDLVNQLLGDTVLMLPGSYVVLNSHWENWNVPRWFRPDRKGVDEVGPKAQKVAEMKALWRALNHLSGRPDDDASLLPEGLRNQKRDSRDSAGEYTEVQLETTTAPVRTQASQEGPSPTTAATTAETSPTPQLLIDEIEDNSRADENTARAHDWDPDLTARQHDLLIQPLNQLYRSSYVLHFTAIGKPWSWTLEELHYQYPSAHPALYDQFDTWRTQALQVCPLGRNDGKQEVIAQ
jgi:hypothetical protein